VTLGSRNELEKLLFNLLGGVRGIRESIRGGLEWKVAMEPGPYLLDKE
jgi:hypothetical protein